jgi:hypothetical protein
VKVSATFSTVPRNLYILVFLGIFFITAVYSYFLREDAHLVEKRIISRQRDVGVALQLRDSYEMKKRMFEKFAPQKSDVKGISLGFVEETVVKTFVGGRLASLQTTTRKEARGNQQTAVEVKVTGAALGEVISFIKAVENNGLLIGKIRLSVPAANPTVLDMQATLIERGSHG